MTARETAASTPSEGVRVTHVVWDLDSGGLEQLVAELARRFAGSAVTMSVVTLGAREGRVGAAIRALLDQFHVLRPVPVVSMVLPLAVIRALRATRADVVHLHSGVWFKGAWAARLAGVPRTVFTEHGREHRDTPAAIWLDRQASRLTDAVVTVSDRLRTYMTQVMHVDPRRLRTIANGVDTETFTPGPAPAGLRQGLGIPAEAWVVGSVGRLVPVKAFDRLVAALPRIEERCGKPVHLVLCGDGPCRQDLERQAAAGGLTSRVHLPGWIAEPLPYYRLFDVYSLCSDSEGLSLSLLEAMACGCAPVVTDVGSNAEVLGPELAAHVVPPGDVAALVEAAAAMLATPERRREAGRMTRERVTRQFSLGKMVADYEALYRELLARPLRAAVPAR